MSSKTKETLQSLSFITLALTVSASNTDSLNPFQPVNIKQKLLVSVRNARLDKGEVC